MSNQQEQLNHILTDLMNECEEVLCSPIRFEGVHVEKIKQVFENHGVKWEGFF